MYPAFSIDQLTAFVAVVDEGSFSAAGRRLGRVQSAISYNIAQLEQALGNALFDRSGHTPTLTPVGRRLAAEARLVLAQARELSERAAMLQARIEPELRVVVDAIFPEHKLEEVCQRFADAFPATALRLEIGLLGDAVDVVRSGGAELGCCNLAGQPARDLSVSFLGRVQLVPVCSPSHALAHAPSPQREGVLRQAIQIVHSERREVHTQDQGVIASRTWRVTELSLKIALIRRGVGWGSLPLDLAAPLLARGELVRLYPERWPPEGHLLDLHAVSRQEQPLGRAGQWFRDQLVR